LISGRVTNAAGLPISLPSAIVVTPSVGIPANANTSTGLYTLRVATGNINVTANDNFANPGYISVSSAAVPVSLGQVTSEVNFVLSEGGRLSGFVTRDGVNGLQGTPLIVTDVNGNTQDQEITDVSGRFRTINITTGTYSISIPLDTVECSSPTKIYATALLSQTVFVGTFTIMGALGTITGNVTQGGYPISTGVIVVASSSTLSSGPPDLSSTTLTTSSLYAVSSNENGTYSLDVRQSTVAAQAYKVYGYYAVVSSTGGVTISSRSLSGVTVTAGQTSSGNNLTW
jgi:hypothetical protein